MGDNLISERFVSAFQDPTQDLDTPISLKMAVKEFRSAINYKSQPVTLVADVTSDTTDALVLSLDNYDIFLGMLYLTATSAIIDCENAIITYPKKGVILPCKKASNSRFSAMTSSNTPDFIPELREVFPTKKITAVPPLRKVNYHINLIEMKSVPCPKMFTFPDIILPAYRKVIEDWKAKPIFHPCKANNPVNMFPKLKPNGDIRLLADLVPTNDISKRNDRPNQSIILRTVAISKYRSSMDLTNWYFEIRVVQGDETLNTIKTPFGTFACKVMMQGDTNAPSTAMRVMEFVLNGLIGKTVWATWTISQYSQTPKKTISEISAKFLRDYRATK